ncbi:MAG: alpha/beta hydrolase [Rhodospirillales bacterium]
MAEVTELNGPRLAAASGGAPDSLVILLHGYGADGRDLIGLAPELADTLPDTAFVAPNGPARCDGAPFGYQWVGRLTTEPAARLAELRAAAAALDRFIDAELARHGLAEDRLALVGFSQGTMMSLHVGPRRERGVAGILGYSGRLDSPELFAAEVRTRPPVVLVHGEDDEVLPPERSRLAAALLADNGISVETHFRPGLGHGIDMFGVAIGRDFLGGLLAR